MAQPIHGQGDGIDGLIELIHVPEELFQLTGIILLTMAGRGHEGIAEARGFKGAPFCMISDYTMSCGCCIPTSAHDQPG